MLFFSLLVTCTSDNVNFSFRACCQCILLISMYSLTGFSVAAFLFLLLGSIWLMTTVFHLCVASLVTLKGSLLVLIISYWRYVSLILNQIFLVLLLLRLDFGYFFQFWFFFKFFICYWAHLMLDILLYSKNVSRRTFAMIMNMSWANIYFPFFNFLVWFCLHWLFVHLTIWPKFALDSLQCDYCLDSPRH